MTNVFGENNGKQFLLFSAVSILALAGSVTAWAGDGKDIPGAGSGSGKDQPGHPARRISWGELQERCANPDRFDVQRPPQNIRIQCTDRRTSWIAGKPGQLPLTGSRFVAAGVLSDKFFVGAEEGMVPFAQAGGSCLRFHEVLESVTLERSMSCAEVLGMKGSLSDFCSSVLDSSKGGSKTGSGKWADRVETGRVADTCAGVMLKEAGGAKPVPIVVR
jgi:hypothetical protein